MKEMKHVTALAGAALSLVCVAGTVTVTEETGVIRNPGQGLGRVARVRGFEGIARFLPHHVRESA